MTNHVSRLSTLVMAKVQGTGALSRLATLLLVSESSANPITPVDVARFQTLVMVTEPSETRVSRFPTLVMVSTERIVITETTAALLTQVQR